MGSAQPIKKRGALYSQCKTVLRPFDLILFSGGDFVSGLIKYTEKKRMKRVEGTIDPGAFSHVGMVVTSDILDHPNILPGKLYIMESTLSGRLGGGVYDIQGKTMFGVQIRDLDDVFAAYDKPNNTEIAYAMLKNPIQDPLVKEKFTTIYKKYEGNLYDLDLVDEFATLFAGIRYVRDAIDKYLDMCFDPAKKWMFCSQLVASVYIDMGILPASIIPEDIVPMDFAGYETTDGSIPSILHEPIYVISELHI
jgi:hypothetical protein